MSDTLDNIIAQMIPPEPTYKSAVRCYAVACCHRAMSASEKMQDEVEDYTRQLNASFQQYATQLAEIKTQRHSHN
ncbi:MAG TPA: hypothetical protein VHJ19_03875 [Gammaproteobacteria bacterium]|nr:hypothetical protein [Gammaproteobacteria bacterium]